MPLPPRTGADLPICGDLERAGDALVTGAWAFRTARDFGSLIAGELERGVLRQGWGYDEDLNLDVVAAKRDAKEHLSDAQASVWRYQWRMLVGRDGAMKVGDFVVVPHQPESGRWSVWRITGDYFWDPLDTPGHINGTDFGHAIPVEPVIPLVHPRAPGVTGQLWRRMKARPRLFSLHEFVDDLARLADQDPKTLEQPAVLAQRLESAQRETHRTLTKRLTNEIQASEFEVLVKRLAGALYGSDDVRVVAGPSEKGADVEVVATDALGLPQHIVIQVKQWTGTTDEHAFARALEQIEQAVPAYEADDVGPVSGAVIVTLLDELDPAIERRVLETQRRVRVPVRVLLADDVCALLLPILGDLASDEVEA